MAFQLMLHDIGYETAANLSPLTHFHVPSRPHVQTFCPQLHTFMSRPVPSPQYTLVCPLLSPHLT